MAHNTLPDPEFARECLDYNQETGEFHWHTRPLAHFKDALAHKSRNNRFAGKHAGSINWYRRVEYIRLDHRCLLAHRLAWLIVHGDPGPMEIDHIDNDSLNNRIDNLRLATSSQNSWNMRITKRNRLGIKGISQHENGKFRAVVGRNWKHHHIGYFTTLEEAITAREEAIKRLHGEFARQE